MMAITTRSSIRVKPWSDRERQLFTDSRPFLLVLTYRTPVSYPAIIHCRILKEFDGTVLNPFTESTDKSVMLVPVSLLLCASDRLDDIAQKNGWGHHRPRDRHSLSQAVGEGHFFGISLSQLGQ